MALYQVSLFRHVIGSWTSTAGWWDKRLKPNVVKSTAATVGVDVRAR